MILVQLFKLAILAMSVVGFFNTLIFVEKKYGKKAALIVSLILGVIAILGLILHSVLNM